MNQYRDKDGVVVEACEIIAPTILNTTSGEQVGEAGQYMVTLPSGGVVLLDPVTFSSSFTLVE